MGKLQLPTECVQVDNLAFGANRIVIGWSPELDSTAVHRVASAAGAKLPNYSFCLNRPFGVGKAEFNIGVSRYHSGSYNFGGSPQYSTPSTVDIGSVQSGLTGDDLRDAALAVLADWLGFPMFARAKQWVLNDGSVYSGNVLLSNIGTTTNARTFMLPDWVAKSICMRAGWPVSVGAFRIKMSGDTVRLSAEEPAGVPDIPAELSARCNNLGFTVPALDTTEKASLLVNSYVCGPDKWRALGWVCHGLHAGADRLYGINRVEGTVDAVGGRLSLAEAGSLLESLKLTVSEYHNNPGFDAYVTALKQRRNEWAEWFMLSSLENPPDLYTDPYLAAAIDAVGAGEVGSTQVAGKPLSQWRTEILAMKPRKLFHRAFTHDGIYNPKQITVSSPSGFMVAECAGGLPKKGSMVYLASYSDVSEEQAADWLEAFHGYVVVTETYGGKETMSDLGFAHLGDMSAARRWLYTVAGRSEGLDGLATAMATLCQTRSDTVVQMV